MQNIIIPVDFSKRSKAALNYAATVFGGTGKRFILLHAYSNLKSGEFLISIDDIIEADIRMKLEVEGKKLIEKLKNDRTEINYVCERSDILSALAGAVSKYNADLIVLGSSDEESWSDVTYREEGKTINILKSVKIPCMIVPDFIELHKPAHVLFATVLNGIKDSGEVRPLLDLLKNNNSRLDILNVTQEKNALPETDSVLKKTTNGYFPGFEYKLHTAYESDIFMAIDNFANEHHNDLICLMYRKHNAFERLLKQSVSKKMITKLTRPLLVLKQFIE